MDRGDNLSATMVDDTAVRLEFTDQGVARDGVRDAMVVEYITSESVIPMLEGINRVTIESPQGYQIGSGPTNAEQQDGALVWDEQAYEIGDGPIIFVPEDTIAPFVTTMANQLSLGHVLFVAVAGGLFISAIGVEKLVRIVRTSR